MIERPRGWRGFRWVLGHFGGVLGCNTHEAFTVPRLTIGVSNGLQMARNLTCGLPVVNQGCLASLGPIRKCLNPTHERKLEMTTGGERSAGMQNGQRGKCSNARDEHVCKYNAHDDMISYHIMTTRNQATALQHNNKAYGSDVHEILEKT